MTKFRDALSQHVCAKQAIRSTLYGLYNNNEGNGWESFLVVAQWVIDNAPDIAAYQIDHALPDFEPHETSSEAGVEDLTERISTIARDIALVKDWLLLWSTNGTGRHCASFALSNFGPEPTTPEARKLFGLDVATSEPEPVYEWKGNIYAANGCPLRGSFFNSIHNWVGVTEKQAQVFATADEARAWVEGQFKKP